MRSPANRLRIWRRAPQGRGPSHKGDATAPGRRVRASPALGLSPSHC